MDRRTLLAITLCFLIYMGWQKYYLEPRLPTTNVSQITNQKTEEQPRAQNTQASPEQEATATAPEPAHKHPSQTVALETPTGPALLGDGADVFADWNLKNYHEGISASTATVNLPYVTHQDGAMSLAFDDPAYAYLDDVQGTLVKTPAGVEWTYEDRNVKLTRQVSTVNGKNYLGVNLTATFKKKPPKFAFVSLTMRHDKNDFDERDREMVYWSGNSIERVSAKGAKLKETINPVKYVGINSRYFLMAILNGSTTEKPNGLIQPLSEDTARVSMVYPVSGNTFSVPLKVFFGPKELNLLRSVDMTLDHTVNFGWFTIFAFPILKFLKFLYTLVGNYGVAIILLTIVIKLLTYPLTYKSMKNMKEMAKIQPQLAKIREKYKNDKDQLNREMLGLMKTHGYNPAAGCLPMIIQIPIFFALDRVLYASIDLYHAPFAFYIHDLAAKDPYYITPILLSLIMWVQQKVAPTTTTVDPAQQKMMQWMPLMFGAFMLNLPAGLNLYMLINSIASIGQQLLLNKKFNPPGGGNAPVLVAKNA